MATKAKPSAAVGSPARRYLKLVRSRIRAIRRDMPALVKMGEKMAASMLAGGRFFAPKLAAFWPSEFGGRAGGFMGLARQLDRKPNRAKDIAYVALPDPARWDPANDKTLAGLLRSPAQVFAPTPVEILKKGR